MEELVRAALSKYMGFVAEAELYERWLSAKENPEIRRALTLLEMKITAIQSWFNLLNADERFVIQITSICSRLVVTSKTINLEAFLIEMPPFIFTIMILVVQR